jgi:hypothetical protein
MALCVVLQLDGTLVATGEAVADCTGHLLLTPAEHALLGVVGDAFAPVDTETAVQISSVAFMSVIAVYVAARCVGAIVEMFND